MYILILLVTYTKCLLNPQDGGHQLILVLVKLSICTYVYVYKNKHKRGPYFVTTAPWCD